MLRAVPAIMCFAASMSFALMSGILILAISSSFALERVATFWLAGFDDPDCRFYCMEDVELYRFPGTLLHDPRFVAEYPELIINLMVSMSTKVLVMHANLSETGGGTAVKQVSLFLCGLSRLHGDKLDFNPQMTQEELAIFLGMHRATLVRALRVLRGCGALLQLTKNRLRIGDLALLQKIAGE